MGKDVTNVIEGESRWGKLEDMLRCSEELLEVMLHQDTNTVAKILDKVHTEQILVLSYHDENSLSCVVTLAYFSAKKIYIFIREFPTGKGFVDIVMFPYKQLDKLALVIELKWDTSASGAIK